MYIHFTQELSGELLDRFDVITEFGNVVDGFFRERAYSSDLETLFIAICCMHPRFDSFFKMRKQKYTSKDRVYIHRGVMLEKKARTYEYELRLNFDKYVNLIDIRPALRDDIIDSLDNILLCKKIRNIDLTGFKQDFRILFESHGWL